MITVPIERRRRRYVGVSSPIYLEKPRIPQHPNDLADHDLIAHMFRSRRVPHGDYKQTGEKVRIRPRGRLIRGSRGIPVAAVVGGQGILFSFQEFVLPEIQMEG